jgi:hypothetical protein
MTRMWHQHVRRVAAVDGDAEMARRKADVLVANLTGCALSAAHPGIDRGRAAGLDAGLGSGSGDSAGDFVAEGEWQRAARPHVELLAVAERKKAVLDMQVGMADTAAGNPDKHLGALGLRVFNDGFAQRRAVSG